MPEDLKSALAALSAAIDERDAMHHELGQIVRDLSGHDEPHVVAAVDRAKRALEEIAYHEE